MAHWVNTIRNLGCQLAVVAGLSMAASPALADWYGTAVVSWVPPTGCNSRVGDSYNVRYRRPYVANNDNFTALIFYSAWGSQAFQAKGHVGHIRQEVTSNAIGWDAYKWTGAQMRIQSISPSNITGSTKFVNMVVEIGKWWGEPKCSVTLTATLIRKYN
jgi:hypothetical protein